MRAATRDFESEWLDRPIEGQMDGQCEGKP